MKIGWIWFLCGLCCIASDAAPAPASSVADQASAIAADWREIEPGIFEKSGDGKTLRLVSGALALSQAYEVLTRELAVIERRRKVATEAPTDAMRYRQMVVRQEHLAALLTAGNTALLDPRDGRLDTLLQEIVVQAEAGAQQGVARMAYEGPCEGVGTVAIDFSVDQMVTRHRDRDDGFAFARLISRAHPTGGRQCTTYVSAFLSGCDRSQQGFELYVSDQNDHCVAPTPPLRLEIFERVLAFGDTLDAAFRATVEGGVPPYTFTWTVTLDHEVRHYTGELMRFRARVSNPPLVRLVVLDNIDQPVVRSFQVEAGDGFKQSSSEPVGESRMMTTPLRVGTTILKRCRLGIDLLFQTKALVYGGSPPYRYEWEAPSPFEYIGGLDQVEAAFVLPMTENGVARVKVIDANAQVAYGRVYLQGEPPEDPENRENPEDPYRPRIPNCVTSGGGGGSGGDVDMDDPMGPEDGEN